MEVGVKIRGCNDGGGWTSGRLSWEGGLGAWSWWFGVGEVEHFARIVAGGGAPTRQGLESDKAPPVGIVVSFSPSCPLAASRDGIPPSTPGLHLLHG